MYVIREYTEGDLNRIVEFWLRNSYFKGVSAEVLREHLRWKYDRDFTKLWVASDNNDIIGSCGNVIYPLSIDKGKMFIQGNWGIDVLVDRKRDKRETLFVFFRVFRNSILDDYRKGRRFIGLCFPNEVIRGMCLKVGWKDVPVFWHWVKKLPYGSFENKKEILELSLRGINFVKIKKFDGKWDSRWKDICERYNLIGLRSAHYLNWRYFQCPTKKYSVFVGSKGNRLKGYIILGKRRINNTECGYILDLLVDPTEKQLFKIFMAAAVIIFKNRRVGSVHFYNSYKPFQRSLIKLGFLPTGRTDFFIYGKDNGLINRLLKHKDFFFVTAGDGDFEME